MVRTQTLTILFCDLVASTERRARMGDDAFDAFTQHLMAALRTTVAQHNGHEVKSAGDGMMVVFPDSVADAVSCATDMHRAVAELDDDQPRLRIGISTGEVASDGLDYTGMPIVEAARLEAAARPGQTLANAVIRALVGSRRSFRFADVGALDLKGLPSPLATVEVVETTGSPPPVDETRTATRGPRRTWLAVAGGVAVLLVVVGAVLVIRPDSDADEVDLASRTVVAPTDYTPTLEPIACPADIPTPPPEASCSYLVVPQDRSLPNGRQTRVLVARAPARVSDPSPIPTIDLCMCENLGESIARDHSELIQMGSRGWAGSDPMLTCPEMTADRRAALEARADDPAATSAGRDALEACRARLVAEGIDPAQYNASAQILDVADLMVALGISQADFTSTGAVSAVLYQLAGRYPDAVRSMTIEDPAPPGTTPMTEPIGDLRQAFERLVGLCEREASCAQSYPQLGAQWKRVVDQATANPALVTAPRPDDDTAPPIPVLLDGFRTVDALFQALTDANAYGLVPTAITDASSTTSTIVAQQVLQNDWPSWDEDYPWGALASYNCAYDVHTVNREARALQSSNLPQFVGAASLHWDTWCDAWDVPDVSESLSTSFVGTVPALLFRGSVNPIGNDSWIPAVQRGLEHAQVVVFPTLGAGLLGSGPPCLSELRRAFLEDPLSDLDTEGCAATSPPVEFTAPG